jgi:hypothetical protein
MARYAAVPDFPLDVFAIDHARRIADRSDAGP